MIASLEIENIRTFSYCITESRIRQLLVKQQNYPHRKKKTPKFDLFWESRKMVWITADELQTMEITKATKRREWITLFIEIVNKEPVAQGHQMVRGSLALLKFCLQ